MSDEALRPPVACPQCMTRGILLRDLAGHIERAVSDRRGDRARDLLALGDAELAAAVSPDPPAARRALAAARSADRRRRLLADLEAASCGAICTHMPGWPEGSFERLGDAAPRALYLRGEVALLDPGGGRAAVTIVGTRRAGAYGREVASSLAAELGAVGAVVVSGLAFGIDSAAHRGALAGGGSTVAVLAAGPERAYPRSARHLFAEIAAAGLVVSELPPSSPTFRWQFPARNRLMAALGELTVVVEAAERSGSLITAEMAGDCGRTVGAVPGPVTSWRSDGPNMLIADGARLVRGAADVIEQLYGIGVAPPPACGPPLDERRQAVLGAIAAGAATADAIAAAAGLPAAAVSAALGALELEGYVQGEAGGGWRQTSLRPPAPESGVNTMPA